MTLSSVQLPVQKGHEPSPFCRKVICLHLTTGVLSCGQCILKASSLPAFAEMVILSSFLELAAETHNGLSQDRDQYAQHGSLRTLSFSSLALLYDMRGQQRNVTTALQAVEQTWQVTQSAVIVPCLCSLGSLSLPPFLSCKDSM